MNVGVVFCRLLDTVPFEALFFLKESVLLRLQCNSSINFLILP